jgi:hypothetical protein
MYAKTAGRQTGKLTPVRIDTRCSLKPPDSHPGGFARRPDFSSPHDSTFALIVARTGDADSLLHRCKDI